MMLAQIAYEGTRAIHFLLQAVEPDGASMTKEQFRQQIALEALRHPSGGGFPAVLGVLVPYAVFAMVVAIVWLRVRHNRAQLQFRAEFQKHLLDKFASGKELAEFLATPEGRQLLEDRTPRRAASRERPFGTGIVLSVLGVALCILALKQSGHSGLLTPGVICLALGVGFLISSAVAYRMSRNSNATVDAGAGRMPTA